MTTTAAVHAEHPNFDVMTALPAVMVTARNLKPGHVVLDPDFHTPLYSIDHRNRAARNSGDVALFVFDYETRSYHGVSIFASTSVPVAAR